MYKRQLLLWFFLSNEVVEAANLPVSASLSINPPYSIYLNDYTESALKMNLSLFVADLEIENLRVRLRITIEGNGISIHSKPEYMPTPILLNGGSSEFIDGQELLGYLSTQNLNYQGPGRDQFYANSKLPEGIYRFCIEVIEINRNAVVSNQACATSWVILNDPPIWNLPTQSEIVRATNPQNILFNWTPRHTGSPNAAFSVLYEVTMVEIFPEGRNANDAINSQTPFHQFTTTETQFVMSPSDPTLTPGRSYAVRLKAIDQLGYDLFKNQGFSEVLMFTFGDPCNAPTDIVVNNISQSSADLSWAPSAKNTAFRVDLREVSTTSPYPISDWYSMNYNTQKATIYKLESGKKYEYKLYANCQTLISEPTLSDYFSTNPATNPDFNCNQNNVASTLAGADKLKELLQKILRAKKDTTQLRHRQKRAERDTSWVAIQRKSNELFGEIAISNPDTNTQANEESTLIEGMYEEEQSEIEISEIKADPSLSELVIHQEAFSAALTQTIQLQARLSKIMDILNNPNVFNLIIADLQKDQEIQNLIKNMLAGDTYALESKIKSIIETKLY